MATTGQLLSIEAALEIVAGQVTRLSTETVPLDEALGRFLAEPLEAAIDLPPFRNSAMDGYAVRAADTPGTLTIVGEAAAGTPFEGEVGAGEAVAISTGAVVPPGGDTVVPVEEVQVAGTSVEVAAVRPVQHIRQAGSDVRRGELLLDAGVRIAAAQVGAIAAVGLRSVTCRRRPRVAVIATGSELRAPGEPLGPGQIYDSNGPMLDAALRSAGAQVAVLAATDDTAAAHRAALERALEHDVVITSGGVSVGDHDLVRSVGEELGVRELFWRIAMRPGKPLSFGVREQTLVFGLPGNPVSSLVCFELFVRPALLAAQGAREFAPAFQRGVLSQAAVRNPVRDDLIRVRVDRTQSPVVVTPLPGQQSHQIAVTAGADALARIPPGEGRLEPGTQIDYLPIGVP
jgi:molybdopterin molybdotransferase